MTLAYQGKKRDYHICDTDAPIYLEGHRLERECSCGNPLIVTHLYIINEGYVKIASCWVCGHREVL